MVNLIPIKFGSLRQAKFLQDMRDTLGITLFAPRIDGRIWRFTKGPRACRFSWNSEVL